ncbi:MAG TPA: hypothetical protein EYH22_03105, partial [Candidatus Nanopusillus sp.]|nr:hypothetical protein [Candidatus Nanopusillus sp.]
MKIQEISNFNEIEHLEGNILLLASPSSGKTYSLLEIFKDADFILDSETRSKFSKKEIGKPEKDGKPTVIVDDVFKVIVEEGFENLKNRVNGRRVIAVTTPYRGEFLVKTKFLEEFGIEKIVLYKIERERAEEIVKGIVERSNLSEKIKEIVDISKHIHNFNEPIKHDKDKYENYPVFWIYDIPLDDVYEFDERIDDILKEFGKGFFDFIYSLLKSVEIEIGITEIFKEIKNIIGTDISLNTLIENIRKYIKSNINIIDFENLAKIGINIVIAIVVSISLNVFGLSLAITMSIILKNNEEKEKILEVFRKLRKLPPHKIEEMEKKAGLPPLTLFTMVKLLSPEFINKLEKVVEEFDDIVKDLEGVEEKLEEFETKFEEICRKLKRVDDLAEVIEKNSGLRTLKRFEKLYIFEPLRVIGFESPEKLRYVTTKVDDIFEKIEGKKIVIIEGRIGSGKTILGYLISKRLEEEGYEVRVAVERLKDVGVQYLQLLKKQGRVCLFIDSLVEIDGFRNVLYAVKKGFVDFVVITCGLRMYSTLENSIGREDVELRDVLDKVYRYKIDPIKRVNGEVVIDDDYRGYMREILVGIRDTFEIDVDNDFIEEVIEDSAGVLTAAVFALKNKRLGMLKERVKYIFNDLKEEEDRKLLWRIATFRGIYEDDLEQLPSTLDQYIVETRRIEILPHILALEIFKYGICNERYFLKRHIREFENSAYIEHYLLGITKNFIDYYFSPVIEEECENKMNKSLEDFVKYVDEFNDLIFYIAVIDVLSFSAPLKFDWIDVNKFSEGCRYIGSIYNVNVKEGLELLAMNIISRIVIRNKQINDAVKFSLRVADKILANKELFMMNVLSMTVAMIFLQRSPKEAKEWFDTVIEKCYDVAEEMSVDKKEEISANKKMFMMNVLSMIVPKISDSKSPKEAKEWFDTVIEKCYDVAEEMSVDKKEEI